MKFTIYLFFIGVVMQSCNSANNSTETATTTAITTPTPLQYELVKIYPHDTTAYTQGLEWDNNHLIEGTGLEGKSILHIMDTNMHTIGTKVNLDQSDFGEGTTLFKNKIYQLTWKNHKVYVYDAKTLHKINELYWPYEGWGLTHNDTSLIVSTGESNIYFVHPDNFAIQKTIGVYNNYGYVSNINELEFANGLIWANIYGQNDVILIDPNTGLVKHTINFANLLSQSKVTIDPLTKDAGYVLNGIAYHPNRKTFFITGKCWPIMAEIKIK